VAVEWIGLVLLTIFCTLDRTAVGQFQLSRPLVCASAAGYLLGVFPLALQLGLMIELLWLMRVPVGAAVAPDDTSATIGGVVLLWAFSGGGGSRDLVVLILVALICLVTAEIGKILDIHARHRNEERFQQAVSHLADQCWQQLERNHLRCTVSFALSGLVSVMAVVAIGWIILLASRPLWGVFSLGHPEMLKQIFPVVGVAAMLAVLQVRRTISLFVGGFLLTYGFLCVVNG
jgi:PTS system mannose-specific IIC component